MISAMNSEQQQQRHLDIVIAFKNLPPEAKEAYQRCMKKDAVFKSALPALLGFAGIGYGVSYMLNIRSPRMICTTIMGLLGYVVGKAYYSFVCIHKHAPSLISTIRPEAYSNKRFDQEGQFVESSDDLIEQEPAWSINDTFANSNQFDDTSNEFEEELSTAKPLNPKQYITYESLRKQHREKYYKQYGGTRLVEEKPKRDKELEDDTFSSSETKEDIWS